MDGLDASTDGVEKVTGNDFLVSCWNGIIYYISADGSKQVLLDTREQKSNTADIGYDSKNRMVYVPTFFKNSVAAYELKLITDFLFSQIDDLSESELLFLENLWIVLQLGCLISKQVFFQRLSRII